MNNEFIPVYRPDLSGKEKEYVLDCLESSWISSLGSYIDKFEKACAAVIDVKHAIAVSNGTVALHLALHCLDIGPGDEVIVPTFTYIASVNTITQTGAKPIFCECRKSDWLIDPADVERRITARTKAIVAVHLFGAVCDMRALRDIANKHGLTIVEDCAESLGSRLAGRHTGTFGEVGTFSFFGNKTITTGEGGMVVTNDDSLAERLRRVKGQGQSSTRRYWHVELGFNYRMTNICAAIGLAQMERFSETVGRKREIARLYRQKLAEYPFRFQHTRDDIVSSDWLVTLLLPKNCNRDRVMEEMLREGVETRPVFYCAHKLPMYFDSKSYTVSEEISERGISLPSYPGLTNQNLERIVRTLTTCGEINSLPPIEAVGESYRRSS